MKMGVKELCVLSPGARRLGVLRFALERAPREQTSLKGPIFWLLPPAAVLTAPSDLLPSAGSACALLAGVCEWTCQLGLHCDSVIARAEPDVRKPPAAIQSPHGREPQGASVRGLPQHRRSLNTE